MEFSKKHNEILMVVFLTMLLEATLVVSDVLTFKVTSLFSVILTIPALIYPITYAIGDIFTEGYGKKTTFLIFAIGVTIEVIADLLISYSATVHDVFDQKYFYAFNYSLGKMHIAALGVVFGSIIGFMTNTTMMQFLKTKFSYRSFPIRTICSSLTGEIMFTITAFSIWFYSDPNVGASNIIKLIISSASLKVCFAIAYSLPAFKITKCLIKNMPDLTPLRIIRVVEVGDKKGNSIFEFQIGGKRVTFSAKSKQVTLNMFCSLSKLDQKIIAEDLKGGMMAQLENWMREKYENSIGSRRYKWDRSWDSRRVIAKGN